MTGLAPNSSPRRARYNRWIAFGVVVAVLLGAKRSDAEKAGQDRLFRSEEPWDGAVRLHIAGQITSPRLLE